MPPQELIREEKISKDITTHVKRKSSLYGKRVSNNNCIIIKFLPMIVSKERISDNEN